MIELLLVGTIGLVDGCDEENGACSVCLSGVIPGGDPLEAISSTAKEGSSRRGKSSWEGYDPARSTASGD